ncbi:MAG: efflux RND transporter permease subunit [Planctomycetota bacterium]
MSNDPCHTPVRGGVIGLFVDRPVTTLMAFLAIVLIGAIALDRLPLRFLPAGLGSNQVNIWVSVPGNMAPQEVQEKVCEPLVELIRTIPGLKDVRSSAHDEGARVSVEIDEKLDPSLAAGEVRDRIQRVLPQWPAGVDRYFLWKEDGSAAPLAFVQLLTPQRNAQWDHLVDEVVRPRLEAVDGVGRVDVWGLRDETIKIWFDRDKLQALNLDFRDVLQRLQRDNFAEPCGELQVGDGSRSYLLRVDSKFHSTTEITQLPLRPGLRLSDVAVVERVPEVRDNLSRYNGKYTYTAIVRAGADANPVESSDGLHRMAEELRKDARLQGIDVRFLFDQGKFIREGLSNLVSTAIQGGVLALIVLWLFVRNLTMTFVIALSIPMTLLVAAAWMFFSGASLDICTMAGLTLAVGMVVDNSVVVLENIRRFRELGYTVRDACIAGAREVGLAVTMSTLTTVVVFLPLAFMGTRNSRALMGSVGIPLSVALMASLFVGLWFLPSGLNALGGASRLAGQGQSPWSPLHWMLLFNRVCLRWALRRRWIALGLLLALFASISGAASRLDFAGDGDGGPFQSGDVTIHFAFPRGYDIDAAEKTFLQLEQHAMAHQAEWGVDAVGGRFGRESARLEFFKKIPDMAEKEALRRKITESLPEIPGVRLQLGERQSGRGGMGGSGTNEQEKDDRNFVVRLWGRDPEYLSERAFALCQRLQQRPEVEKIEVPALEDHQEVVVEVDRSRLQDLGIDPESVLNTMASGLQGRMLGRYEESDREVPLMAQFDARDKPGMLDLKDTRVFGTGGTSQRLADLSKVRMRKSMPSIESIDGRVQVTLVGQRREGMSSRDMSRILQEEMETFPLARGYSWSEDSGQRKTQAELIELLRIMALSITLVFLLMGVLFESVILPLSILVTIPCALWGAMWSLAVFQGKIDPMGMIGMVILCGVVVNNGIVLLDHIVRLRRTGMQRDQAIREGVEVRLRPIFMTAATTFVGLLPMALFGDANEGVSYVGLSIAVVGGLLFSTITTAIAVPLCYTFADDLIVWLRRRVSRRSRRKNAAQPERLASAAPQSL